jgi:hypothetical protein
MVAGCYNGRQDVWQAGKSLEQRRTGKAGAEELVQIAKTEPAGAVAEKP